MSGTVTSVLVLRIEVSPKLLDSWPWLMPERQPFVVPHELRALSGWPEGRDSLSPELRDSFELYGPSGAQSIVWLSRSEARKLPESVRCAQPSAHRWPSESPDRDRRRVIRYVESGRRASRHMEITDAHWAAIGSRLPGARMLAGRFPMKSGPNCFGTVMAVAGVQDAEHAWMQIAPFEDWLALATSPGGDDDDPGTVLVWRVATGQPVHAAITIGEGWLIHKPSQGWMSPVKVLAVSAGKYSARTPGRRLSRRRIS